VTLRSSLYVGSVTHRRLRPRQHNFRYRAFWILLDLSELDQLSHKLRWFSYNRPNLFSLYDTDHGDGTVTPLRSQVERWLAETRLDLADGSIELLCMPRTLGYCFNPLSIYFCRDARGALAALIYEVHNTFGERHSYIIPVEHSEPVLRQRCSKAFYVSPFMDMGLQYEFRVASPDERIAVAIRVNAATGPVLNAVLAGERRELNDRTLSRVFLAMPAITWKVTAAIRWEALHLWLKGIRVRQRPEAPRSGATIMNTKPTVSDW
jgi:DUF1365 family protein